jgi:hypothetical protein
MCARGFITTPSPHVFAVGPASAVVPRAWHLFTRTVKNFSRLHPKIHSTLYLWMHLKTQWVTATGVMLGADRQRSFCHSISKRKNCSGLQVQTEVGEMCKWNIKRCVETHNLTSQIRKFTRFFLYWHFPRRNYLWRSIWSLEQSCW